MHLTVHSPLNADHRRRLRRLGFTRRLVPLIRLAGKAWVCGRVEHHLSHPTDTPWLFMPVPWVQAAWGTLPDRSLHPDHINTILADWVDCGGRVRNTTDYFLGAGDWAPIIRSTDGDPVREEARQLQAADLVYTDTAIYQALLGAALAGDPHRRQGRMLYAREDVDAYFERFVRLFRSIKSHGVLPHAALDAAGLRFNQDRGLGVAVDADGRLHRLQGGNHRWAIAQVLGLSKVPVELRLHHVRSGLVIDG